MAGRGAHRDWPPLLAAFIRKGAAAAFTGVPVSPGDLVMPDDNGVVVVPENRAPEALELAQRFAETEERVKDAIARGVDPVEAHQQVGYDSRL